MASRKSKKVAQKEEFHRQIKEMIENGFDLFEIADILELKIDRVLLYCSQIEMAPTVGDVDLNWYINGYFIYQEKKDEIKEQKIIEKNLKPKFDWFNYL